MYVLYDIICGHAYKSVSDPVMSSTEGIDYHSVNQIGLNSVRCQCQLCLTENKRTRGKLQPNVASVPEMLYSYLDLFDFFVGFIGHIGRTSFVLVYLVLLGYTVCPITSI